MVKKIGLLFSVYLLVLIAANYYSAHSVTDGQNAFIYGEAYRVGSIYNHINSYLNIESPTAILQTFDAFILSSFELNFLSNGYNQQILYSQLFLWALILNYSNFKSFTSSKLISLTIAGFVTFNPITYRFLLSNNPYILSIIVSCAAFVNLLLYPGKTKIEIIAKTVTCVALLLILSVNIPILIAATLFLMISSLYIKRNNLIFLLSLSILIIYVVFVLYSYVGSSYKANLLNNNSYFLYTIYNNFTAANIVSLPFLVSQSGTKNLFGIERYFIYIGFVPVLLSVYYLQVIYKNKQLFWANVALNVPLLIGGTFFFPVLLLLIDNFPFVVFKSAPEKFSYLSLFFFALSISKINLGSSSKISTKLVLIATGLYVVFVIVAIFNTILGLNVETVHDRFQRVPVSYFQKFKEFDLNIVKCRGEFIPTTTNIYNTVAAEFPIDLVNNSTNFIPEYFKSVKYVENLNLIAKRPNQYVVIENMCNGMKSPELTLHTAGKIYDLYPQN